MSPSLIRGLAIGLLGAACMAAPKIVLAQGACTGYIESLPVIVASPGHWCLREHLSTSIASGAAVSIRADDVTLDCNDFKIGGIAAGAGSMAVGIHATGRSNLTIRNCRVRGFHTGIAIGASSSTFYSSRGHLVEDNRLDQNLTTGISVRGLDNRVRRNAVFDTGGHAQGGNAYGISAQADITDNVVAGVFLDDPTPGEVVGIQVLDDGDAFRQGGEVRGNAVRGLLPGGILIGISAIGGHIRIIDNQVAGTGAGVTGTGILSYGASLYCMRNSVTGFSTPINRCVADVSNLTSL